MDFDHIIKVIIQAAILSRYVILGKLIKMGRFQIFISKKGKGKITN